MRTKALIVGQYNNISVIIYNSYYANPTHQKGITNTYVHTYNFTFAYLHYFGYMVNH